jgi:hypothetical protein
MDQLRNPPLTKIHFSLVVEREVWNQILHIFLPDLDAVPPVVENSHFPNLQRMSHSALSVLQFVVVGTKMLNLRVIMALREIVAVWRLLRVEELLVAVSMVSLQFQQSIYLYNPTLYRNHTIISPYTLIEGTRSGIVIVL